jgi:hypothetical protein
MSDSTTTNITPQTNPPPTTISTPSLTTVSGVTTRNMSAQQARVDRQNADNANASAEIHEKSSTDKRKERIVSTFKGRCTKMNGNVFELSDEGRSKSNQFTETMKALYRYASQELECVDDLDPLFATPIKDPSIPKPSSQPPLVDNPAGTGPKIIATRDHFEYHDWKNTCDEYAIRRKELKQNNIHLFAIILDQCSTSVENKLKGCPGYSEANTKHSCYWLLTNLKHICLKYIPPNYLGSNHASVAVSVRDVCSEVHS